MGRKYDFRYMVIGSGAAGSAAAISLAKAKKNVALVEGGRYGGANLNTLDVPYAVTLDFAHSYYKTLHLPEFSLEELSFGFPTLIAHQMKAVIEAASGNNPKTAEDSGLLYIPGYANFIDPHTVVVGERQFTSENFILATGAHLNTAGIAGLDSVRYLSPETALKIRRLPTVVLIVGGGATGCELAEYYATLGAQTLIAEQAPRLLPHEDPEIGAALKTHFVNDLGIMVLTDSRVTTLAQDSFSKYAVFQNAGAEKMVRIDTIILATGSAPTLNYGLDRTGVKFNRDGSLQVDKFFQTSAKHIFAIGDCALGQPDNPPSAKAAKTAKAAKSPKAAKNSKKSTFDENYAPSSSTERAGYEGRLLASFLSGKPRTQPNYRGLPRLVNTLPGIACSGPTEAYLRKNHVRYKKALVELRDTPAGKIHSTRLGFVKLLADHSGRILAGQIVAEDASALAGEISLAIRHRLTALELASTPHPANDFSYAIQLAAKQLVSPKN